MEILTGLPIIFATLFILFMTAGIVAVVIVAVIFVQRGKDSALARSRALHAYASGRGWHYAESAPTIEPRFSYGAPFREGSRRTFSRFIGFTAGGYVGHSFDYQYDVRVDKTTHTYYYHVVALELPVGLPNLVVRPEGLGRAIAQFFGMQDIQFESEDFNRAWHVTSTDSRFAHDVINPQMIEWLLDDHVRFANFTIDRDTIYTFISAKQDPQKIEALAWYLTEFLSRIPPFVWDKARGL